MNSCCKVCIAGRVGKSCTKGLIIKSFVTHLAVHKDKSKYENFIAPNIYDC